MLELSFEQLQAWLSLLLWPFMRISTFIMVVPLLGHSSLPARIKIALAVLLSFVVSSTLPALPNIPIVSWAGLGIMIEQLIIGLGMAMCMLIVFTVVQLAGEFIGLQMGLGFASFFSPDSGANTMILSRWLYMISLLMFLAFDGHLYMIRILAESFVLLPIGAGTLNASAFETLVRFSSIFFILGMLLALPLVAALLIMNLTLGILNRAAPQFTVFSVGFPMSLTTGLLLIAVLMNDLAGFLESLFLQGLQFMQTFVALLGV